MMLKFIFPWIFLLLPLPLVIYYFSQEAENYQENALKIPFYQDIIKLPSASFRISISWWRKLGLWLIWILLLCAASGPLREGEPVKLPQIGRNMMLAIDLSGSMETPDMLLKQTQVDRLTAVKAIASDFIQARRGDRLGLIVFGSKAYLETPLTFDLNTINSMLQDSSIGLAGSMTAMGDAIGLAIKRLLDTPLHDRVIILLTDGANNTGALAPLEAANLAKKYHIKIYTIGFGSGKTMLRTPLGVFQVNPDAELDEETLKKIAAITGGRYFRARDTTSLAAIYRLLNQLEPTKADEKALRSVDALYIWPLAGALLLSVVLFFVNSGQKKRG